MMNRIDPLQVVIDRLGCAAPAKGAFFFWDEVKDWPPNALELLESGGLLQPVQPMATVECDGCEDNCLMPVTVYPAQEDKPGRAFITCNVRDDMGRIRVSLDRLRQWQCSIPAVCEFIATSLGLRRSHTQSASADLWNIGIATGNKRSQMLCLRADKALYLVAGNDALPMTDLIVHFAGKYSLDAAMVRQLVDSATTADTRYTPNNAKREARKLDTQAVHERWQKAYRLLKKKHPDKSDVWCSLQIAKTDNPQVRGAETIRKHMKK